MSRTRWHRWNLPTRNLHLEQLGEFVFTKKKKKKDSSSKEKQEFHELIRYN